MISVNTKIKKIISRQKKIIKKKALSMNAFFYKNIGRMCERCISRKVVTPFASHLFIPNPPHIIIFQIYDILNICIKKYNNEYISINNNIDIFIYLCSHVMFNFLFFCWFFFDYFCDFIIYVF